MRLEIQKNWPIVWTQMRYSVSVFIIFNQNFLRRTVIDILLFFFDLFLILAWRFKIEISLDLFFFNIIPKWLFKRGDKAIVLNLIVGQINSKKSFTLTFWVLWKSGKRWLLQRFQQMNWRREQIHIFCFCERKIVFRRPFTIKSLWVVVIWCCIS